MYREVNLDLPSQGVVLIIGEVGAGKTSVGEAISRALTGVPGRFAQLGRYSNDKTGNKNMLVKVEAELAGKPLAVELGYKSSLSKTGEGLKFTYNGEEIQRGHVTDTREELNRMLRMTPELAEWTVFIDGDRLKFNQLSERQAVELLMTALNQPPWTQYQQHATKVLGMFKHTLEQSQISYDDAQRSYRESDREVAQARAELKEAETASLKAEEARKERQHQLTRFLKEKEGRISTVKAEQSRLKKEIHKLETTKANDYAKLDSRRNYLRSKLGFAQHLKDKRLEKKLKAKTDADAEQKKLATMKAVPETCPTCRQSWDRKPSQAEIQRQASSLSQRKQVLDKLSGTYEEVINDILEYQEELKELERQIESQNVRSQVTKLSQQYEKLDAECEKLYHECQDLNQKLSATAPDNSRVTAAQALLAERERNLARIREKIQTSGTALAEATEAVKVVHYWTEAYGPTGIPNMILRETIAPLNEVSKRLAKLLSAGGINVSYDTRRELASGKERAELVIRVDNDLGSKHLEGSSKGERGLTNLIVAETLSEIGQVGPRIGYKWLDEVVNSQSPAVRGHIYRYYQELARKFGMLVFVTDHHQDAQSYADHMLLAEKSSDAGVSLRWV